MREIRSSIRPSFDGVTSADTFVDFILHSAIVSEPLFGDDNIDQDYPAAGYLPNEPDPVPRQIEHLRFVLNNAAQLYDSFQFFEDNASRELFLALILFRILGYRRVRLPVQHELYRAAREAARNLPFSPSSVDVEGFRHYEIAHAGTIVRLDCLSANIFFSFLRKQYYFQRPGITIAPREGDTVIDAGACFGDTTVHFASTVGPAGHVYSFEVLAEHLEVIALNLRQNTELSNVTVIPCALSDHNQEGALPAGQYNPGFRPPATAPFHSLDALIEEQRIPRPDFIKMDIEGAELAALKGAAETIRRFRPRLAISVYHAAEDYINIPRLIKDLCVGYRIFLDNCTISDGETILYATCE